MIKTNCIHFSLDRPCKFHKKSGIHCSDCKNYITISSNLKKHTRILIVKLDAMGDVLRTTFLLPGLKDKYKNSYITWLVAPESVDILDGNPYVDRIWTLDKDIFSHITAEKFDIAVNLDLSPTSLSLATLAIANIKIGFYLDKCRNVKYSNAYAKKWLEMSAFDDLKKANKKTYQYYMSKITGLPKSDYEICTILKKESMEKAEKFAQRHGLKGRVVVGINPGAGKRWVMKKWTVNGYLEIIKRINATGGKVLLFGNKNEEELIAEIIKRSANKAVNTGVNSIHDFFALLNLCDIVITGDTLALHAALGLKKNVVALFGPTSASEIEAYGRCMKIVSPAGCVCCYIADCKKKPSCMELIEPAAVWKAFLSSFGQNILVV
ncbi:MAG: glycosyltransferase family 9 protein [Elusimicrobia bacterium]|nr:glycosyltransferase family 9 protein [Candidatus Liberimonas magnetica]